MTRPVPRRALGLLLLGPVLLAACGGGDEGSSDTAGAVEVVSTADTCRPAKDTFAPGKVRFAIRNGGSAATELYVYQDGKVLTEVENVGPGTSRSLTADLKAGKAYVLSCKPGGNEIKVPISVG
ncbi:MAG: hypothetical protein ABIS47_14515 [Acidimicrobiales bacterium]